VDLLIALLNWLGGRTISLSSPNSLMGIIPSSVTELNPSKIKCKDTSPFRFQMLPWIESDLGVRTSIP
jgi:hypothetical protein